MARKAPKTATSRMCSPIRRASGPRGSGCGGTDSRGAGTAPAGTALMMHYSRAKVVCYRAMVVQDGGVPNRKDGWWPVKPAPAARAPQQSPSRCVDLSRADGLRPAAHGSVMHVAPLRAVRVGPAVLLAVAAKVAA